MMLRKILITNDDGINSDGLRRLVETARDFGEVWVVAPDGQRSAAAHSITLRHSFEVHPYDMKIEGIKAFSCTGTPADCTRIGMLSVMPQKPDVVLAGINFGYNTSSDIQYSATVGAVLEAEFQGCPAIAFSEGAGDIHEVTDKYLKELLAEYIDAPYIPGEIININFPHCKLEDFKGIKRDLKVSRTPFFRDRYKALKELPDGGTEYIVDGIFDPKKEEGTDYGAVIDNYISVTKVHNIQ